eukprot:6193603-Pleurochrysis_carterae.AAC.1
METGMEVRRTFATRAEQKPSLRDSRHLRALQLRFGDPEGQGLFVGLSSCGTLLNLLSTPCCTYNSSLQR